MTTILKYLAVAGALLAIAGCKLAVIVVEGGEVQSLGSGTCQPTLPGTNGNVCIHEVADTNYSETFIAVPDAGWHFVKWNAGDGFLCSDSTDPTCVTSNTLLAGNPLAEAIVDSSQAYYLMPVFTDQLPITDTIFADGKEWAQLDLFSNLSWNEIAAICPTSGTPCTGKLNGYDVDGWIWASVNDVNALFNHYIGPPYPLGPGPDRYLEADAIWATAFFVDGWRPNYSGPCEDGANFYCSTNGLTSTETPHLDQAYNALINDFILIEQDDEFQTSNDVPKDYKNPSLGAWFYRTP